MEQLIKTPFNINKDDIERLDTVQKRKGLSIVLYVERN